MERHITEFIVQRVIGDEVHISVMSGEELIEYINMDDCHDEEYRIFCGDTLGEIEPLFYKGWQPGCLIEVADGNGNIVLRGYGEDH